MRLRGGAYLLAPKQVRGGGATQNLSFRFRDFPTAAQVDGYAAPQGACPGPWPRNPCSHFALLMPLKVYKSTNLPFRREVIEWNRGDLCQVGAAGNERQQRFEVRQT